jgi:hypothetical protein
MYIFFTRNRCKRKIGFNHSTRSSVLVYSISCSPQASWLYRNKMFSIRNEAVIAPLLSFHDHDSFRCSLISAESLLFADALTERFLTFNTCYIVDSRREPTIIRLLFIESLHLFESLSVAHAVFVILKFNSISFQTFFS